MTKALSTAMLMTPVLLTLISCSRAQSPAAAPPDGGTVRQLMGIRGSSPGLTLTAVPVADSISARDSVRVLYFLKNNGTAIRLRNNPGLFHVQVWGPGGGPLALRNEHELPALGGLTDVTLPHDGILGRIINLECYTLGFAPKPTGTCLWSYDLHRPGEYRIVVTYDPIPPPGADSLPLAHASDTVLVYRAAR